ncbi:1,5-anhydro-D-fructose reductase [Patella vulgata]|uniref:1,5-anhydro-D-fructose reductase n=1 Tax=Patella vulgata TaxID=6465 RepID=UPI0021802DE3|nr:1,5-anhydro-D-fructose reductase [Patella vulgata]
MADKNCTVLTLNNGRTMPSVGLGTYAPKQDDDAVIAAVKLAVRAGYRHIDCAAIYRNERAVGHAIKQLIVEDVVKREDLFVTSKLWNTCHRPDIVEVNLRKSLEDLGLEYVDLYLIHWPMAFKEGGDMIPKDANGKVLYSDVDYVDTWKALEDCVDLGLTMSIGCSNFNSKQLQRILDIARMKPVNNQAEVNVYNSNKKLIDFCKANGIVVTASSPLGSPGNIREGYVTLLKDPVLLDIAARYKKSPAQVALRFLIQQGIGVLPKSVTASRIRENFDLFDFSLSDSDKQQLVSLNKNVRAYLDEFAKDHPHYPFHEEF